MTDMRKTGAYIGAAVVLLVLAWATQPKVRYSPSELSNEGEELTALKDPGVPKALEIFAYDDQLGSTTPFRVQFKDKKWTIPSHNDYPADAEDRLYKTAGAIIGLRKDSFITSSKAEHAEYHVVDPTDEATGLRGLGTRVTLYDESNNKVVDLIFGKSVEGKSGFKFVRVVGDDRVFAVKCDDVDLSTRFADWISTDLLNVSSWDMDKVTLKDYRLVEKGGRLVIDDKGALELSKDDSSNWKLGSLKADEETNADKARDVANAIADLKIVGVRPKPPGLTPDLRTAQGEFLADSMARRGFFVDVKGHLHSNDGEALIETKDGLVYTLRFGGVIVGKGDALTAGKDKEEARRPDEKDKKTSLASDIQENRFLLVSVAFNESKFPPIPDPEPHKSTESEKSGGEKKESAASTKSDSAAKAANGNADEPAKSIETTKEKTESKKAEQNSPAEPQKKADDKLTAEKPANTKKDDDKKTADTAAKPSEKKDEAAGKKDEAADKKDEEAKKKEEEEKKRQEDEVKRKREERDRKIKDGKEKAEKLTRRYAGWYYVVSNDSFKKIRLTKDELVKPKEKKDEEKKDSDKPEATKKETDAPAKATKSMSPDEKPKAAKLTKDAPAKSADKSAKPDKTDGKPDTKPAKTGKTESKPDTKTATKPSPPAKESSTQPAAPKVDSKAGTAKSAQKPTPPK